MVLVTSGTQTTDGTENILTTQTPLVATMYILKISRVNMQNGDSIEGRVYTKMLSSGNAEECLYYDVFNDAPIAGQDSQVQSIGACVAPNLSCQFSIKRIAGVDRTYKWELFSL